MTLLVVFTIKNLTNKDYGYDIGGRDLSFGQQVYYHLDKAHRHEEWSTNGREAVWVGRSDRITDGHTCIVVPIEWDPDTKLYKLHPTVHVNNVRYEHIVYPLKMGPVHDSMTDLRGRLTLRLMLRVSLDHGIRLLNVMRTVDGTVYYCNITERHVEEYNQVEAVRQLMDKQNKDGTLDESMD